MKQVLTLVVRIEPTTKQYQLLEDTAVAFASASIIHEAVATNSSVAIEDLTGI